MFTMNTESRPSFARGIVESEEEDNKEDGGRGVKL
jgi:hypothetical protein